MWVFDSHEMPERWHFQREESTSDLPKNHNGQQGGSVLTGTKEDVLGGKIWLPLGLGLKGNSQSCLCL